MKNNEYFPTHTRSSECLRNIVEKLNKVIGKFVELAKVTGEKVQSGNYKAANIANKKMKKMYDEIKKENGVIVLLEYLADTNEYVRLCVASYAIDEYSDKVIKTLEEIKRNKSVLSLFAESRIDVWKRNLV